MKDRFRLTLAQLDATVGDLAGNAALAQRAHAAGAAAGADLVALPEMFMTGYQTLDLGRRPAFVEQAIAAVSDLARACATGPALGIGAPALHEGRLYNGYHILEGGRVAATVLKQMLPNDEVFDEKRIYTAAPPQGPVAIGGVRIGVAICEDAWHADPVEALEESGAEILLVPNGSPYHRGKRDVRMDYMVARVVESGLPLAYLNLLGGQDDQVFDGASFVLNPGGRVAAALPPFEETIETVEFERGAEGWRAVQAERAHIPDDWEQDYRAMVMGLSAYLRKSGFSKVLLGLSGGIDSALVAAIAADALGPTNVRCVMLPSEYTSAQSLEDAAAVAGALGCRLDEIAISGPRAAVTDALGPLFAETQPDLTEENIQSRLRGLLLMALSNKFGEMLLTTGNKSEVAVGYATIYGDMCGGYNPLKDLYKTRVFETCRWRNANHRPWMRGPQGTVIPPRVIDKPPSAELREDQKDEDSLPPYEVLDDILERLVDGSASVADVIAAGHDRETVLKVQHLVYINEWKRFQSAPGPRLTQGAFWLDRRYPMVNRWRDGGHG
ncbi:MAG: NAD+ synthase [Rubricella sp.]